MRGHQVWGETLTSAASLCIFVSFKALLMSVLRERQSFNFGARTPGSRLQMAKRSQNEQHQIHRMKGGGGMKKK